MTMGTESFQLSDESCPFCGARTEKLYLDHELVAVRCIECAYVWESE
ncbi:MAG: hypothetical protein ACLFPN_00540 [Methanomassiliicoccales archaeon]